MFIYLGSIAISWAVVFLFTEAFKQKVKREGYTFVKNEMSIPEKIMNYLKTAFIGAIPILNVVSTFAIIWWNEELYDKLKDDFIVEGKIIRKPVETIQAKQDDDLTNQVNISRSNEPTITKDYNEMTDEEKLAFLEAEKEALLRTLNNAEYEGMGSLSRELEN